MRLTLAWAWASASAVSLAACAGLLGLERGERGEAAGGMTVTSTTQGGGGMGGGGAGGDATAIGVGGAGGGGLAAADWTSHFGAVYRFEEDAVTDSGPSSIDLMPSRPAPMLDSHAMEGLRSLHVVQNTHVRTTDSFFGPDLDQPMTFGAWVNIQAESAGSFDTFLGRYTLGSSGYVLYRRHSDAVFYCSLDAAATAVVVTPPTLTQTWVHTVCRWDGSEGTGFGDGVAQSPAMVGLTHPASATFGIPPPAANPVDILIDEVFFIRQALSDVAIARIHACGIDGARCTCDPDDLANYLFCGRANDCTTLPACNESDLP